MSTQSERSDGRSARSRPRGERLWQRTSRIGAATVFALAVASLLGGCATDFPGDPPKAADLEFPVSMTLHPDGRYLYVLNANFNLRFRPNDGGTLMVIDVESGKILPDSTRRIASFASDIVLNHDASRGYISVRGDSSLTWFALDDDGAVPSCPLAPESVNLGECSFEVPEEPSSLAYIRSNRSQPLLDANGEPLLDDEGNPRSVDQSFDMLAIAHLRDGRVSVATVGDAAPSQEPAFSIASAALVDGPSTVTVHRGERFFVTGRVASNVVAFRPAIGTDLKVLGIFIESVLGIPTPFNAIEGRDLLFSEDGDRLYVTNQAPNSLLVFDTSSGDNDAVSGRRDRLIAQIDLPRGPDRMSWVDTDDGDRLLYITAFAEDIVTIVDPSGPRVVGEFSVGDGPFDMVVDRAHRDAAYVTNFKEHSISVIDISDPREPIEIGIIAGESARER